MTYEVKNWKPNTGQGQIKGYFTMVYQDLEINDCRLVSGQNGDFISFPQRKYQDKDGADKYASIVFVPDKERRQKLNDWAVGELAKFTRAEPAQNQEEGDDIPF